MPISYKPAGLTAVTPYLTVAGAARLIEFLQAAFGAEVVGRYDAPDGSRVMHAALRIDDAMVETGDANSDWGATPAALHLYVADADATYRRALDAGAESLSVPADMPYGERSASVRDPLGNIWYIATRTRESYD